jgi:voltage-gated potassium channel
MAPGIAIDRTPGVRLPSPEFHPLKTLARRLAAAAGLVLLVALIAYLDRDGYTDGAGGTLTPLDAIYYSTVTLTTTGYGDIYPASQSARALTAFVITPLRVVFLVLLVGTTVEILTESTRHLIRVRRWRNTVVDHTIVCGYGTKGVSAIEALRGNGLAPERIVVVEPREERANAAIRAGHPVVQASATRRASLIEADVADASSVVVAVDRDDTAVLTVLTVRELNPDALVSATAREEENAHLLRQSGANVVVPSTSASGRLVGIATYSPALVSVLDDLLRVGTGIELIEREVGPDDVVGLEDRRHEQVILVIRDGDSMLWNDPRAEPLQPGDRLVELTTAPPAAAEVPPVAP